LSEERIFAVCQFQVQYIRSVVVHHYGFCWPGKHSKYEWCNVVKTYKFHTAIYCVSVPSVGL